MDAATPLRQWLFAAGLAVVLGCQSNGAGPSGVARAQGPAGPLGPLAPGSAAGSPAGPPVASGAIVGAPVAGLPVPPRSHEPPLQTASYSALATGLDKAAELLKESVPQVKVVALVGASNLVTDQEVWEAVRQRLGELRDYVGPARAAKERELYEAELRRIIERELILDEMFARLKKAGRPGLIDEIKEFASRAADQNLRAIRKLYGAATEEEFVALLRSQGLTLPVIRRQLERQFMADEYVRGLLKEKGRTIGLADIRAYYDRHPQEFRTDDQVRWLDIFVSFSRHPSPQAAQRHAEQIRQQALAGADFVALCRQYDEGLAAANNGRGIGTRRGEIQPVDVEAVVWDLKPGEVGPLVETPTGYHVIKVVDRVYAGVRPFDTAVQAEIRDKLTRLYREAEYQRLVEELWRKGTVQVIGPP